MTVMSLVLSAMMRTFHFLLLAAYIATYKNSLLLGFGSTFFDLHVLFEMIYF
jgi:hypothetical protein